MDHDETLSALLAAKVIVVLRGIEQERAIEVAGALERGGIKALEFALPHGAEVNQDLVFESIGRVRDHFPGLLVGCGTILSPEEVREAAKSGALFAISPTYDPEVIKESRRLGLMSIPGAYFPHGDREGLPLWGGYRKGLPSGRTGAWLF